LERYVSSRAVIISEGATNVEQSHRHLLLVEEFTSNVFRGTEEAAKIYEVVADAYREAQNGAAIMLAFG